MGPNTLALRTAQARERITNGAAQLAKRFGIELPASNRPPVRDVQARILFALEDNADLIDAILEKTSPAAEIPTPVDVAAQHTVAELRDLIAEADADQLDRIEQAEQEGKNRAGVHQAIEKRRAQLEAEAEDSDTASGGGAAE